MSNLLMNLVSTCFKFGKSCRGVITPQEAFDRSVVTGSVILISSIEKKVFFFTDDYLFGHPYLPKDFVPCATAIPLYIEKRESLPTGVIQTFEEYLSVFHPGKKQINTIEELVALVEGE